MIYLKSYTHCVFVSNCVVILSNLLFQFYPCHFSQTSFIHTILICIMYGYKFTLIPGAEATTEYFWKWVIHLYLKILIKFGVWKVGKWAFKQSLTTTNFESFGNLNIISKLQFKPCYFQKREILGWESGINRGICGNRM